MRHRPADFATSTPGAPPGREAARPNKRLARRGRPAAARRTSARTADLDDVLRDMLATCPAPGRLFAFARSLSDENSPPP